jgi:hypothetical protein
LCVAVDDNGNVATSTNPTGGAGDWTITNLDGTVVLNGVSCAPSTTSCVVVGSDGAVLTSNNPTGGVGAWSGVLADPQYSINWVSCPAAMLCVAVDGNGDVLTSTDPAAGAWALDLTDVTDPPHGHVLLGVSCTLAQCVAVDDDGNELAGIPPAPGTPTTPTTPPPTTHTLSVTVSGPGSVSGSGISCSGGTCTHSYATGTSVTLTATPEPDQFFSGWSGAGCGGISTACTITLNSDQNVTVNFEVGIVLKPLPLQVVISGSGSVLSDGTSILTCPGGSSPCVPTYVSGPATLTAVPAAGEEFQGWSGYCTGTGACTVAAGATGQAIALFGTPKVETATAPPPPPVISKATSKSGTVTFAFASPTRGARLECALVRRLTGKHAHQPKPAYAACGTRKVYRHLRAGSYTLYVRTVSASGVASSALTRVVKIS